MSSIVVTGIGTVGAAGAGFDTFVTALEADALPLTELEPDPRLSRAGDARRALRVDALATREWLTPLAARRMSPPSRLAVAAARMAVRDAGLEPEQAGGERTAVSLGTAWGSMTYSVRLLEQLRASGPLAISPMVFTETVANAPAGQVAIDLAARGANGTLTQGEASGLLAIAQGAAWITAGRADRVLVGAVDELCPLLFAVLARFGALTADARGRPFDSERDGVLASEGATVLVLEDERCAAARGATPRARLAACARANDPSASASDWGSGGPELAAALAAALARAGCAPDSLERVLSGASGSVRGDLLEADVLAALFAHSPPPVLAPKAIVGEYGGGFLAASLWGLGACAPPRALATERADGTGISAVGGIELAPAARVLVSSLSAGGAAAWLVWERP